MKLLKLKYGVIAITSLLMPLSGHCSSLVDTAAETQKAIDDFSRVLQSNNSNSEVSQDGLYNYRTRNDANNLDPLAREWMGTNSKHVATGHRLDIGNTDFTSYSPINIGAGGYLNNEKLPFGQLVISKSGWRSNKSIGRNYILETTPPPSIKCDAVFKATSGITGQLFIDATSVLALSCSNVKASIKATISDTNGNKLISTSSKVFFDDYSDGDDYVYQHAYFIQQFSKVIPLHKPSLPVLVCLKIESPNFNGGCIVGKTPNAHELDLIDDDYKKWKSNTLWYTSGFIKTNSWTHGYKIWFNALMKKYIDYTWVGL